MKKATLLGALALVAAGWALVPAEATAQSFSVGIGGGGPRVVVRDHDRRYGYRQNRTVTRRVVTNAWDGCRTVTRKVKRGNRTVVTTRRSC